MAIRLDFDLEMPTVIQKRTRMAIYLEIPNRTHWGWPRETLKATLTCSRMG